MAKREKRKNLIVKEWNTDPGTKMRRLDRITIYDEQGRKVEETEYASYGQRSRSTFEYYPGGKIKQEVEYDDRNKPVRIRKYEYNEDGTKKIQYNYLPNGKLHVIKTFEYIFEDAAPAVEAKKDGTADE
jgi:antitoxin component YwqK of YwqJK toxin-antitoxin module